MFFYFFIFFILFLIESEEMYIFIFFKNRKILRIVACPILLDAHWTRSNTLHETLAPVSPTVLLVDTLGYFTVAERKK